ncbi:hypothetical protein ADK60_08710 [Streptomyces sp. XY431]|uniref:hypothetical protein n=1 Tax=Streptomyces sp. XY431 TaxID=1415562 RepID=UPI0006AF4CEB|nr:hypothetical protein [Streptomyces sp. XY431]KOV35770.1 hypothetical protein ADK60_08710 [Streptomyces sp. XY431]
MANKLIQAGASRLKKAPDSAVDPAVPAELQQQAASSTLLPALVDAQGTPSVFAGGRVLAAEDITGTPEEQLAYVTARLVEIDGLGRRAEDFVVLNKGVLLETAQQRELHLVAGHTRFSAWASEILDIEEKYVFELMQDAARTRAVAELGPELTPYLSRASARKAVAAVIASHDLKTARAVVELGVTEAVDQGKKRPTAARLSEIAVELTAPSIPEQKAGSEISDPALRDQGSEISEPAQKAQPSPPQLLPLSRAADEIHERAYKALAPAAVKAAAEADPAALIDYLDSLEVEVGRVQTRIAAARKLIPVDAEVVE